MVVPQEVRQTPGPAALEAKTAECEVTCAHFHPVPMCWAKPLRRVFDVELEHCPSCGGELKRIAAIPEQLAVEKILTHLGLQARAASLSGPQPLNAGGLTVPIRHLPDSRRPALQGAAVSNVSVKRKEHSEIEVDP